MFIGVAVVLILLVCGGAVPIIGILAAIAIPNFVMMQQKAKRAEVPGNVDGIRTAEMAYDAAFDAYVEVPAWPRPVTSLGKTAVEWQENKAWQDLGWRPDGQVRGTYWVEVSGGDFEVHGLCDVDGDGRPAEYIATKDRPATIQDSNEY